MAVVVTLTDTERKAQLDGMAARANGGKLSLYTAADGLAAEIPLNATAFGAAAGTGTCTITAATSPNALVDADADGNASAVTKALLKTSAGAEMLQGNVSTSAAALNLSRTTIALHDTVTLSSLVYSLT
jgi:hypothetical protein